MLPQDGTPLHISMIEYFTRFRDDILQNAKPTCFKALTVFHLLSCMGRKGYENGLMVMLAKERMVTYKNGLGAMLAEERMAASAKGYKNSLGPMSASAATKAAAKAAKWTAEVDASIESMLDDGVSFAKIALKLGNGLKK